MTLLELFVIAVGLSMDAFAVSVCKGLSVSRVRPLHALTCGGYFGLFQGIMPLIGWLLGTQFKDYITAYDHWIALILLSFIGINMIREALSCGLKIYDLLADEKHETFALEMEKRGARAFGTSRRRSALKCRASSRPFMSLRGLNS